QKLTECNTDLATKKISDTVPLWIQKLHPQKGEGNSGV
ncbi:hypothetical protein C8D94_1181, partial [Marinirhabdus gelatinilytica]